MNQLSILDIPEVKSVRQLNTFGLSHDIISIIESRDKVQLRRFRKVQPMHGIYLPTRTRWLVSVILKPPKNEKQYRLPGLA